MRYEVAKLVKPREPGCRTMVIRDWRKGKWGAGATEVTQAATVTHQILLRHKRTPKLMVLAKKTSQRNTTQRSTRKLLEVVFITMIVVVLHRCMLLFKPLDYIH